MWMGTIKSTSDICQLYNVDDVLYMEDRESYLQSVMGDDSTQATKKSVLLVLKGTNSDSGVEYQPPNITSADLQSFVDSTTLFPILAECRVTKSKYELDLLRHVTELTSMAHVYTMKNTRPQMMEYQCESLFRHYCYYNHGKYL